MRLIYILNIVYLVITWHCISTFHRLILVPSCELPILRNSGFCSIIRQDVESGHTIENLSTHTILCQLPGFRSSHFCALQDEDALASVISEEFRHLDGLFQLSADSPRVIQDIRDAYVAISDLTTLVQYSDLKNKAPLAAQLQQVGQLGRQSSRLLQAYVARLMSATGTIIASADYTIELVDDGFSMRGYLHNGLCAFISPWYGCQDLVQESFYHTLRIIETLILRLTEFNAAADDSLTQLEAHLEEILDLVEAETKDVKVEVGELLGRLWTILGGNRGLVAEVKRRKAVLSLVGERTRLMRKSVWDVQRELDALQLLMDELRSTASEPLLVKSLVPKSRVMESLAQGVRTLQARVAYPNTQVISSRVPLDGDRTSYNKGLAGAREYDAY